MDIGGYENFKDFKDKAQQAINFVLSFSYVIYLQIFFSCLMLMFLEIFQITPFFFLVLSKNLIYFRAP